MIQIREAVIVEGKYDKIKLSSIIDGLILVVLFVTTYQLTRLNQ